MSGLSRAFLFALAAACLAPEAAGQLSAGGNYSLDLSVQDSGGGNAVAGGNWSARGSFGQTLLPSSGPDLLQGSAYALRRGFYNPPRFSLQNSGAYTAQDPTGAISLLFSPFSVAASGFDVLFRSDPAQNPLSVDPAKIANANSVLLANQGPVAQPLAGSIWEVKLMDENGVYDAPLLSPSVLSIRYPDAAGDGIADGTSPPVRVKTLSLWTLDEALGIWVKVPDSGVDPAQKRVAAPVNHLSVYTLIGGADSSVGEVSAFPVPFRPNGPKSGTGPGRTGTESAGITFANLPSEGRIDIYNLVGQRVRKLDIPANLSPARLVWDVKNESGHAVASGVYIWRVVSGVNSKTGRLMVIR
ncbi:MAG: hypothetical protein HY922_14910 [Elusimicrobia bacterium]|nr:hypothetical protein [Elusimicrobiota bacterium]